MKYFIFFICVVSLIVGLTGLVMYFTDYYTYSGGRISYDETYLVASAIGFGLFLFTAFYLWKNNFFKRN